MHGFGLPQARQAVAEYHSEDPFTNASSETAALLQRLGSCMLPPP